MIIGTVRVEEAKVFDENAGYYQFHNEDGEPYGSFEVFWHEPSPSHLMIDEYWEEAGKPDNRTSDEPPMDKAGWFWWACFPGCLPDGEPSGPFSSSTRARADADPQWLEMP